MGRNKDGEEGERRGGKELVKTRRMAVLKRKREEGRGRVFFIQDWAAKFFLVGWGAKK